MAILTITEFVKRLQTQAAAQQADVASKVLKGMADQNEYFKQVGKAQGIGIMADIAYQLMKRADLDDDDDDLGEMPPDDAKPPGRDKKRAAAKNRAPRGNRS